MHPENDQAHIGPTAHCQCLKECCFAPTEERRGECICPDCVHNDLALLAAESYYRRASTDRRIA